MKISSSPVLGDAAVGRFASRRPDSFAFHLPNAVQRPGRARAARLARVARAGHALADQGLAAAQGVAEEEEEEEESRAARDRGRAAAAAAAAAAAVAVPRAAM